LLYFYPKDMTPGCTAEACAIRDSHLTFQSRGFKVLGVSADSEKRHRKFADKYDLPFTLLSDESKDVMKSYGAWGKKKFMGREYDGVFRISFLIDPDGKVSKVYDSVKPSTHAKEVLEDQKKLS